MTDYVLAAPQPASVPVAGSDTRFPVRRIYCVGRNYAEHAREMGHDPDREPPFFFSKPADALLTDGGDLPYPPQTADLHFEAELVVALGRAGRDIPAAEAQGYVWGYAAGCDFTRRDLQAQAKKQGRPWDMAKGFDLSAACGTLHPLDETGMLEHGAITLELDGETRQKGDLADMIWSVPEIIAHLSRFVALAPGDLIYTGTPAGVGAVKAGQIVTVGIEGLEPLVTRVVI
ncbi:fumarylacetoacetate hydrolase family protein [Paracoccus alkanivorans]|uniref:FAA hydrolase family protein n=1 Tax=Paracoccus alkanivorans TaxID=2116655 RepID=A0A3M0MFY3_9RHOB|nr:fumarylacetoacetate hydrolase family protein [Paracoccus alkanivorans]RMC36305.1 FAA hydrolase family protein [Paracoccus alkanivorans]